MEGNTGAKVRKIAFIGNYLPRQCGIATFTTDLVQAVDHEFASVESVVLAMNDIPEGYGYSEKVRFQLDQQDLVSYQSAADFINLNNFDMVCLQHEYGIFGGEAGAHILTLLRQLEVPVVTTLHTVLRDPDPIKLKVMKDLVNLSDRMVVMSERGLEYLENVYQVPREKIDLIPHGIHDVPFVDPNFYKDKFNVEGRPVLLTFGLLSANKGIEYVIRALPAIKEKYPNIAYLSVGATHPHVLRHEGEKYRDTLKKLIKELDLEENVIFYDRFVSLDELVEFIGAADIYITPYLNRDQITSGTLAYTVGAGKAVISTPYWHAEELLADGRGILIPFRNERAIADQVIHLLDNEAERHAIRKRAYMMGRSMVWSVAAQRYMQTFEQAIHDRIIHPRYALLSGAAKPRGNQLPDIQLDHLLRMTDSVGIFQHANHHLPNYAEGYTTDDNARALMTALFLSDLGVESMVDAEELAARYLAFLEFAFNPQTGRFRNFMSFDRRWLEEIGSEDSHGRALWALGAVLGRSTSEGLRSVSGKLFEQALPAACEFNHPRPMAYTLIGISEYLRRFPGDRAVIRMGELLSDHLLQLYRSNARNGWLWYEDNLTYSNALLPMAMLATGRWRSNKELFEIGLSSLKWLVDLQTSRKGHFSFIGNNGFYSRGGPRSIFDQQPIEAGTTVSACLEAYKITADREWYAKARRAFDWFLGKNDIGLPLYNEETGGCRDGMHPDRLNQNQGSESLLAYLSSLLELYLADQTWPQPVRSETYQKLFRQRT